MPVAELGFVRYLRHPRMKTIFLTILALSYFMPLHAGEPAASPRYTAKAAFEYTGQIPPDADKVFADNLPRGEHSATIHQTPNTSVFWLSVSASSPEAAATRANQIVLSFRDLLSEPNSSTKTVLILNLAHASEATPQTE